MISRSVALFLSVSVVIVFFTLVVVILRDNRKEDERRRMKNIEDAGGTVVKKETGKIEVVSPLVSNQKLPRLIVNETSFDFGAVNGMSNLEHRFPIRNEGDDVLTLQLGSPSCSCISANLERRQLAPGEETFLSLRLNGDGRTGNYQQGVNLFTNDPSKKYVPFYMIGQLRMLVWFSEGSVFFANMGPKEERTLEFEVFAEWADWKISDWQFEPKALKAEAVPLSAEELKAEPEAKSGYRVKVTCLEEAPNTENGFIRFTATDSASGKSEAFTLSVMIERLGAMGVFGAGLDELGRIKLGQIDQTKGLRKIFTVKARGKNRKAVVKSITTLPPFVKVSLEPSENVEESGIHKLILEIPPDSPEVSHLGNRVAGSMNIEFEGDEYPPLKLDLQFAVVKLKPTGP